MKYLSKNGIFELNIERNHRIHYLDLSIYYLSFVMLVWKRCPRHLGEVDALMYF